MIVCVGEALIDFLPRKTTDGSDSYQPFVGGSVLNVAVAIGRLGAPAGFFCGLSEDFFGAMIREALIASKVDFALCPITARPTTLAFVKLTNGNAEYAFFDEGSALRMMEEADLPPMPAAVTAMHFGSIGLTAEPVGSAYETMMRDESADRLVSFDPNVRPSLVKNREGYIARIERMVAMADVIKLSREDLEWLAPERDFETVAAEWLKRGASLVILTQGADGARAIAKRGSVFVRSVAVTVADTIGAGDTFSAAVLARLHAKGRLDKRAVRSLSEDDLTDLLSYAAKAASITSSRPGADPPWSHEMA
ncbi:MAG: carbohydrate kinase [Bauldia sp.]|nr:carbohydrate kinase [Bauldia sp.]